MVVRNVVTPNRAVVGNRKAVFRSGAELVQNREDGIDVYDDVGVKRLVVGSDAELLLDRVEYAVYGYHSFDEKKSKQKRACPYRTHSLRSNRYFKTFMSSSIVASASPLRRLLSIFVQSEFFKGLLSLQ